MDYDDNDFQSQNLHLAGEGSTKFPPALRPYALSKFDFDESLHGNLRFDSLVETEVFLGIESNEDNQWIDAFSRGGSGIEFSSTAAESCSISRHGNVWSEATSSESVEMLLKSVGQEEFIPRQTVIQESDACDELACIAKQMDSNPKPDDKNEFKHIVTDSQPPGSIPENLPGLKEDVAVEQSLARVSQSQEGGLSIDGSSGNPEVNDICRDIDLPVSEGNPRTFTDNKSNNTNQTEVEAVAGDLHEDKTQDDSSVSGFHTDVTEASIQNMGDKQQGALQTPTNKQDMESSMMNNEAVVDTQTLDGNAAGGDAHHPDKSLCSIPTTDALEGGNVGEALKTGVNSVEESLGMESISVSELQKAERCSENVCSSDLPQNSTSEDAVMLKDEVMVDQSALDTHELPKVSKDDSISKGKELEISNPDTVICPNLQQNVHVVEKTAYGESSVGKENKLLNTGDHMDTEISVLTAGDNNMSKVNEGILGESDQVCENNKPDRFTDQKFGQDASVDDHESKRIPSDSNQIHGDVDQSHLTDKGVGSSSLGANSAETELTTSKISINVTPIKNSASQVVPENISSTSLEVTDMPPPSNQVVSTHEVTGHNEIQGIARVGPSVDEKEESAAKIAVEAGVSAPLGPSEDDPAPCPISGTEKHHSSDTSIQLSCETVTDEGTSVAVNTGEPQVAIDDKAIQGCTKEVGVAPVLHESADKQGDIVTVVTKTIKDDQDNVQGNCDKSSSGDDILPGNKASLSSATLPDTHVESHETGSFPANTTCSPLGTSRSPIQTEKDENHIKASSNLNPAVSEFTKTDTKNTLSTAQDLKGNNASKDDRSLTLEVNPVADLSKKDVTVMNQEDFHKAQPVLLPVTSANKTSSAVDGSPLTFRVGPSNTKVAGNISHGSPQVLGQEVAHRAPKATPERKARRASNKTPGKESSRKGSRAKDTTLPRQSKRGGKSTNVSLSPSPGFQLMRSNEEQKYGHIDPNSTKPFALVNASTSNLPDLNSSASPSVLFHQPFTDLQQVQLRAQIFVYGALIQGTAPDEAYMISAFGGPDGGRSTWENAWRACMERQLGQKSHPVNPETPLQSRSGSKASDLAVKQSAVQGKGISSPLGQASSKATPTVLNPLVPLSSPLWNLPTPSDDSLQPSAALARGSVVDYSQALTPLHPYQTPPLRNYLGHNTSWIPQASLRGPWFASPSPATDNIAHLSASPVSDTIKLTSTKGPSLPPSSGIKNVTPSLPASGASSPNIFIGTVSSPLDANNVTVSPAQHSSDPKPKKRKKATMSEDLGQKTFQSLPPAVSSHVSTSVAIATPVAIAPITTGEKSVVSVSPLTDHLKSDQNVEKRILSDESLMKVKETRLHAEEASALSAAAVNHSLEIWTQLDKHKNSGLMPDIEAKLASAAVAVAAAAAVAKAAAAAANVALNAAVQAKLMADEALISSGYENSSQINKISLSEGTSNFGKASPASILKGANGTNSPGSIIVAAKEAVRRRVEAASAATKRAENMDAIVKAAELAAEAVSQAGKIVTMGDPLPLSDLVEAGPEGCFKAPGESSQQGGLLEGMTRDMVNIDNIRENAETSNTLIGDFSSVGISTSVSRRLKGRKVSDSIKPGDVIPESEPQIQASFTVSNGTETLDGNSIKEGSLVEVYKDEEGFKAAWFTANIVSVKDGKAYVCYTSLVAVEGAGPLKEWVALEGEGDKPPRIRTARPLSSLHYEGTRKRRRAAMGDYTWSVGDKVDALMQESWWEGVITEKNKKDEFTVHFPASGETMVVKAWHLRPSLIWKDGKWTESSKVAATDNSTHEGDTPREKRPKLGDPVVETKGKEKMLNSTDTVESSNPEELRLLNLTENEKVFNIGNSGKNDNKPDTHRMPRTGLQKEGSKVIFGVPKPGKKRKFMEVSKHYVAQGSSKISDRNDSVKLSNFLMPQGSGPRGWKNGSKNDTKDRVGAESKPKTKSGKPQTAFGRAIPPKDSSSGASSITSDLAGHTERIKDSIHFKNASESESHVERATSATDGAAQGPILFSSLATSADAPPAKKTSTSRASKGKLAPAGGKSSKGEMEKPSHDNSTKSTSDVIEPRRSNRRIQPTSRLLEGLQSSLIISKIPSASHNRNASKGNN